jgi:DNA-binding NarL/FixJ family response regulator
MNEFLGTTDAPVDDASALAELTARQRQILDAIARGLTNPQIAGLFGIIEKTVRNHITTIFAKLGAQHRSQAIVIARKAGLGRD